MVIEGKLHKKEDTTQVSESFSKRDFVVEYVDNPLYPQYITFQLIKDRCSLIDSFEVGDSIEVTFNLRGREWTSPQGEKKYFNTLEAWRVQKQGDSPAPGAPSAPSAASEIQEMVDQSQDLPF